MATKNTIKEMKISIFLWDLSFVLCWKRGRKLWTVNCTAPPPCNVYHLVKPYICLETLGVKVETWLVVQCNNIQSPPPPTSPDDFNKFIVHGSFHLSLAYSLAFLKTSFVSVHTHLSINAHLQLTLSVCTTK